MAVSLLPYPMWNLMSVSEEEIWYCVIDKYQPDKGSGVVMDIGIVCPVPSSSQHFCSFTLIGLLQSVVGLTMKLHGAT